MAWMLFIALQVWAHQHGLSTEQSADGLGGHLLAMLLVHLATKGKLVSGRGNAVSATSRWCYHMCSRRGVNTDLLVTT
jgi:hypothetical protein